jgi:transposase
VASLRRWLQRERETGSAEAITGYARGPAPKIDTVNMEVLRQLMSEHRDATNAELADMLASCTGVEVSAPTVSRAIGILGWTREKSATSPPKPFPRVLSVFVKRGGNGSEP